MIVVIVKNGDHQQEVNDGLREKRSEGNKHERTRIFKRIGKPELAAPQTKQVINFFTNDLTFDKGNILYFTEDEVRTLVKLFD